VSLAESPVFGRDYLILLLASRPHSLIPVSLAECFLPVLPLQRPRHVPNRISGGGYIVIFLALSQLIILRTLSKFLKSFSAEALAETWTTINHFTLAQIQYQKSELSHSVSRLAAVSFRCEQLPKQRERTRSTKYRTQRTHTHTQADFMAIWAGYHIAHKLLDI